MSSQNQILFQRAIQSFHVGDFSAAEQALLSYLGATPNHFDAFHLLAIIYANLDRWSEANECYKKALQINPSSVAALSNWGSCLTRLGQNDQALNALERALTLEPKLAALWFNTANILCDLGRFERASQYYEKALYFNPDYFQAHNNYGKALFANGQFNEALANYNKALELNPDFAEAWSNKGITLQELKRYAEAIACYDKSLCLNPGYAEAWSNKGITLQELKRFDEALNTYNKALELNPDFAEAWSNKGNTLNELKRYAEAIACYDKSLCLNPGYAEAWSNKGAILNMLKLYPEAIIQYEKILSIDPNIEWALGDLIDSRMKVCFWDGYQSSIKMLVEKVNKLQKIINPFKLLALQDDARIQKKCAEIYSLDSFPQAHTFGKISKKYKHPKIRIAYFSADYREHPTAQLTAELFELHDRSRFELFAFSFYDSAQDSKYRTRIKNSFENFYEVENKTDQEIAQLARDLEIDIAIDLGGYTQFARTGIFACRAAPIQVNYLGYPGTMGASYMDYIVADPTVIPESSQKFFSEKVVYLPDTYQPNDRKRQVATKVFSKSELGLPDQGFIFCCFNNNFKINPEVLDSWARILSQVPGSVLWLLEDNPSAKNNLMAELEKRDIASDRLIFAGRLQTSEHLARHAAADLFLDTWPYNAHTTASDALWAGLPVLTRMGQTFASRVAASLLNAIDLPELITSTSEEYEALAVKLATHPEKLQEFKERLKLNRLTKPLFNTELYTKHLETAYLKMYERYQADLAPGHIFV
ncbi:tetratricopeptide repeat protein [Polynucleobacter sp. UB-Raua-W9]|uniref:tetratricopeptide repeat protein n=1 Tax=Polynucleobacter sp. UB-Raua-W9 TaxID=1819736 RepID=UPI001BFE31BA|nr:tetratricopeptide repeat protein [Polynucleobacter sp. UB-Raua-W9]QWD72536.1 tetratricopeptide repeat protein [Polynucleobacter sp. UB-Raua-W9]